MEKHEKAVFRLRLALWVAFAAVAPIVFIAIRFGVFTHKDAGYRLTGWGVIALIVLSVVMYSMIKEAMIGLPRGSMLRQCVSGYVKLVPLILITLMLDAIKENIDSMEQTFVFITISEAIAIPINPLPKWADQHGINLMENTLFNAFKRAISSDKESK